MRKKKKHILPIVFVILFLLVAVFGAIYYYEFNKMIATTIIYQNVLLV